MKTLIAKAVETISKAQAKTKSLEDLAILKSQCIEFVVFDHVYHYSIE